MSVGSLLSAPVRTRLPGEDYLRTFDQRFQVERPQPLRTEMFTPAPLPEYRARTERGFMQSKGMLLDLWA